MATEKREEYLECIYKLQQIGEVTASKLVENLGLAPSSVTEMIQKLREDGLISREKRSISLTKEGEKLAFQVIRKHRLVECFFVNMLGLKWEDVHEEACKFEHILSAKVADALEKALDYPLTCPHGNPIPTNRGGFRKGWSFGRAKGHDIVNLINLGPGDEGFISKITGESHNFLKHLSSLGLIPQTKIKVEQIAPFHGPLLVRIGKSRYALGRGIASRIWVTKLKFE